MFMRSIASTMIVSAAIASAIALAQSSDTTDDPNKAQSTDNPATEATEHTSLEAAPRPQLAPPSTRSSDNVYLTPLPVGVPNQYSPSPYYPGYAPTQGSAFGQLNPDRMYQVRPPTEQEQQEQRQAKEFGDAVKQLRRAETEEEKSEARTRLNEMVGVQLERDFKEREQKLAEIETRAKELREQLERRRSSKDEIQKMLLMLIESPESGLGLPPAWMNSLMGPSVPMPIYPAYPHPTPVYAPTPTLQPASKPTNKPASTQAR